MPRLTIPDEAKIKIPLTGEQKAKLEGKNPRVLIDGGNIVVTDMENAAYKAYKKKKDELKAAKKKLIAEKRVKAVERARNSAEKKAAKEIRAKDRLLKAQQKQAEMQRKIEAQIKALEKRKAKIVK